MTIFIISRRHRHVPHLWVFLAVFALMLVRRVTGFISCARRDCDWFLELDAVYLPTIISALMLVGLLLHLKHLARNRDMLEDQRREYREESREWEQSR